MHIINRFSFLCVYQTYQRLSLNLANEMAVFLIGRGTWYSDMKSFLESLGEAEARLDAVIRVMVMLANYEKDFDHSITLLSENCFPTYATDRSYLMSLWNEAVQGRAGAITDREKHNARMQNPVPRNIGCNKGSKYCLNYW